MKELIKKAMPYPDQITFLERTEVNAIRFKWRGDIFRVSNSWSVEEVDEHMLIGSNSATLIQKLIETCRNQQLEEFEKWRIASGFTTEAYDIHSLKAAFLAGRNL